MDVPRPMGPDAAPAAEGTDQKRQPPRFDSRDLFLGGERLLIDHRGEQYLLRITRQGKLILTK